MSDMLRWGVLGAAGIARGAVVPAIQKSRNGRVAAVASRDPTAVEGWAKAAGIGRVFGAYEDLLGEPEIDAIYIPLPNSLHAQWAVKAAAAGKAVLCEKPLTINAAEATLLAATFAERRLPLMEGFMYRFHPQHARVLQLVQDGAIGEVLEVQAHLSVDLMSPVDPRNVRFSPTLGGGARFDMGCYTVSIARRFLGAEPTRVLASQWRDERFGVDVSGAAFLDFGSGRSATIGYSFAANGQGFYRLIGRLGMIDVPRAIIPGLGDRSAETLVILIDGNGRRREEEIAPADQYCLMAEAFAAAVLEGRPVPIPPSDSIANMRVLDAIAASAETSTARVI